MAARTLTLRTPSFGGAERIPRRHARAGGRRGIDLEWSGEPAATRSFVVMVEDTYGGESSHVPWARFDVPADVHRLSTHESRVGLGSGDGSAGAGWPEPSPPEGEHQCRFQLFALDLPSLDLPAGASVHQVRQRMAGHVLESAELTTQFSDAADPVERERPDFRRVFWVAIGIYVAGAIALLLLGFAGIFVAPFLGAAALVVLLIWGWRRMAAGRGPGEAEARAERAREAERASRTEPRGPGDRRM